MSGVARCRPGLSPTTYDIPIEKIADLVHGVADLVHGVFAVRNITVPNGRRGTSRKPRCVGTSERFSMNLHAHCDQEIVEDRLGRRARCHPTAERCELTRIARGSRAETAP